MYFNFLILAHKNKGQLIRLIRKITESQNKDINIFIHLDKKWQLSENEINEIKIAGENINIIPPRVSCRLDDWSLIEAELQLLDYASQQARNLQDAPAYYIMMSGQDYPIKSIKKLLKFLKDNYPKPFIDVTPHDKRNWVNLKFKNSPLYHTLNRFQPKNKILDFLFRAFRRGIDICIPGIFKMEYKFKKIGVKLYGGSQWWILPDIIITEILSEWKNNTQLIELYYKTLTPEETFFQTMTMRTSLANKVEINPIDMVSQNCLTFANFSPEHRKFTGHPYIITCAEFEYIKDYPHFIARKFDETVDSVVFDLIDEYTNETP